MKKKFLILGTGYVQNDAIRYLQDNGFEVHGAGSFARKDHGLDAFLKVDIKDEGRIIEYASSNKIEHVYSIGSDCGIKTAAAVAEKLGLRTFVSLETVEMMNDKYRFHEFLRNICVDGMDYLGIEHPEELSNWQKYPCVIKPIDSQGQRGVFKAENFEQLSSFYLSSINFSASGKLIVENFVSGLEVSVNLFLVEGEIKYCFISDRYSLGHNHIGIPDRHIFPSSLDQGKKQEIKSLCVKIANNLGIANGPIYMQLIINEKGSFIIEATPRLDGCHLWRLIKMACGVDLLDLTFRHFLEESLEFPEPEFRKAFWELKFRHSKPGTVFKSKPDLSDRNIFYQQDYYQTGDTIRIVNGYQEKTGYSIRGIQ